MESVYLLLGIDRVSYLTFNLRNWMESIEEWKIEVQMEHFE
jgi:hypothetical protein